MAHQLDESLGRPAIAYIGDTPWHRLGTVMPEDADLDQWRIADDKRFVSATWGTARNRKLHAWKMAQELLAA